LLRKSLPVDPESSRSAAMIGHSPAMQRVYKLIGQVAGSDATVLVRGESGTGKELVVNAIHENSSRANGPLLKVNCAAIPENLLESELFGMRKARLPMPSTGASGALKRRTAALCFWTR
jgi:two-component system response regulator AtoC